ncbi:hypothetical protein A7U60_g2642 [Sanghuangporus baumii]|uniref:Uncharacterized protein n=1 Tax=Sanghuangporus baumii TaxID=108892 RepID=A0A9Q5N7X2_SANBA|nr:hypothetical protein A7U60_g2642 [Sanghuangporus baumii]
MLARFPSTVFVALSFAASAFSQAIKVEHITVGLNIDSLTRNQASLNFDGDIHTLRGQVAELTTEQLSVSNSGTASTTIKQISADLGTLVIPVISFNHSFDNFVVPAGGTVNSGTVQNATLSLGALSLVQLVLLPTLDIISGEVTLSTQQSGIPTNFTLNLA